jgi:hypothetical protein
MVLQHVSKHLNLSAIMQLLKGLLLLEHNYDLLRSYHVSICRVCVAIHRDQERATCCTVAGL